MSGENINSIDDRLSTLQNVHGYQQHVSEPTRGNDLLDLLITSASSPLQQLVLSATVVSSYDLSDNNRVVGACHCGE